MSRYSIVSRAYPQPYRADHLPELIDTANESTGDDWSLREARALLAGGFRTRCRVATNGDPSVALTRGVRLGVFLSLFLHASFALAMLLGASTPRGSMTHSAVAPIMSVDAILLLGMVALWRGARWPTTILVTLALFIQGVTTLLVYLDQSTTGMQHDPLNIVELGVAPTLIRILVTAAAIIWLHRHNAEQCALPLRWIAGLIGSTTLIYTVFGLFGGISILSIALMLGLPAAALLLAPVDPRLAVATAVTWPLIMNQLTAAIVYQGKWILLIAPCLFVTGAALVARSSTRRMARI